jgi:hypothetical protein
MSCKIKIGVTHLMRRLPFHEGGGYHHHEEEKEQGLAAPLYGLLPPSPIYMLDMLLFYTHLVVFHPLPCCSKPWLLLKQSAAEIFSHQHLEEVEEEEEFRWIPTSAAPLDRGHGGRHRIVRVTEYGGAAGCGTLYTILRSSSEQLHRLRASSSSLHRQCLCGNVIPASGHRGLVNRCFHLVDDLG